MFFVYYKPKSGMIDPRYKILDCMLFYLESCIMYLGIMLIE